MDKYFETILRQTEQYYGFLTDRLLTRQDNLFKTYLWSASLALTINLAMLKDRFSLPLDAWEFFSLISLALAFLAVLGCLYSLRGRDNETVLYPDLSAYLGYLDNPDFDKDKTMRTLIGQWFDNINQERAKQSLRAQKLRSISKVLSFSFAALALAGAALFVL
ncbi:MAG: hypothetical protein JXK94_13215 [Deltaproteobacteria bacterium]|nr:hypothetical protein [Deltaproteobacteria bacterium]